MSCQFTLQRSDTFWGFTSYVLSYLILYAVSALLLLSDKARVQVCLGSDCVVNFFIVRFLDSAYLQTVLRRCRCCD